MFMLQGMICMDAAGMVMGWRFFDHAAHLSGLLYGIFWCHLGKLLCDQFRFNVISFVGTGSGGNCLSLLSQFFFKPTNMKNFTIYMKHAVTDFIYTYLSRNSS